MTNTTIGISSFRRHSDSFCDEHNSHRPHFLTKKGLQNKVIRYRPLADGHQVKNISGTMVCHMIIHKTLNTSYNVKIGWWVSTWEVLTIAKDF